jgi:Methyltransferase domain
MYINVGCGKRFHSSWLNLDLHCSPGVTQCDLTKGIPAESNTADAIYSAAVLEHIRKENVASFFSECHRTLKPGGILRIAVPDLELQVREYLAALERVDQNVPFAVEDREWMVLEIIDQATREKGGGEMLAFLSNPNLKNKKYVNSRIGKEGAELIDLLANKKEINSQKSTRLYRGGWIGKLLLRYLLKSSDIEGDITALNIGRFRYFSGEVHQWSYDRISLQKLFQTAGFSNICKCDHGISRINRWAEYNLEIDTNGIIEKPDLLIMEAIK